MSETDDKLARCEDHIADLMLRITELKEASSASGLLDSGALLSMLQRTLESWEERKTTLLAAKGGSKGLDRNLSSQITLQKH
jgi:hypothetical protein